MFRHECIVLCDCDPRQRIQAAASEHFCVECKSNMFEYVDGVARCLHNPEHRTRPSARCLNKSPRCGHQSALGECKYLPSVRRPLPNDLCASCKDPDGVEFVIVFTPCGHVMCLDCFPQNTMQGLDPDSYLRMVKSRGDAWVPACRLCKNAADPGSCDFSSYNLLPKEATNAIRERAARMAIGEEEGIVCPQCCAINTLDEDTLRAAVNVPCANEACGALICIPCRRLAAACLHCPDPVVVRNNFIRFARLNILMRCPSCGEPSLKDGACNHVDCESCDLSFCFACGRSTNPQQHRPVCTNHPFIEFQDEVLQEKIVAWNAKHWQNVFFLVRAYVVVRKFVSYLTPQQLQALTEQPCPVVDLLVELTDDFEKGAGVDGHLNVSSSGWSAFLSNVHPCSAECKALADTLYPEWFVDMKA